MVKPKKRLRYKGLIYKTVFDQRRMRETNEKTLLATFGALFMFLILAIPICIQGNTSILILGSPLVVFCAFATLVALLEVDLENHQVCASVFGFLWLGYSFMLLSMMFIIPFLP